MITFDRPAALLPIDMQQAFDMPPWPRRWNMDLDRNGRTLLNLWRNMGWPIIHVQHDSIEPNSTLRPDRQGHAFRDGFTPQGAEPLVRKNVNAAFIGTDLELRLRRLGIETVAAFGMSTDICHHDQGRRQSRIPHDRGRRCLRLLRSARSERRDDSRGDDPRGASRHSWLRIRQGCYNGRGQPRGIRSAFVMRASGRLASRSRTDR